MMQEGGQDHRGNKHHAKRVYPRHVGCPVGQNLRNHISGAGFLEALTDRNKAAEHDNDRPLDGLIGLFQAQLPEQQDEHGGAKEADIDGYHFGGDQHHRNC